MKNNQEVLTIKQLIHQVIPYKKGIVFFGSRAAGVHKKGVAPPTYYCIGSGKSHREDKVCPKNKVSEGINQKNSDYDILVIVHHKNVARKRLIRFQAKIKRLCAKVGLDADVIVRDKKHAEEMKKFPGNIIHSAFQTGIHI
jgi:hypothetical protein